jgi:hypothetical protein
MSIKRADAKIERIMGAAYEAAFQALEAEVKAFMVADPRFVEYIHAVGWGPMIYMTDGKSIQYAHDMPTKRGHDLMDFCDRFYDAYGAGNERVSTALTIKGGGA